MAAAAPMIAMTALQTVQGMQQQKAASKQAGQQADYMEQMAARERAQAERNAEMVRRQREMEKSRERRNYEQELARARVGGVSAESLLASADRFSLSSSQKDWLTGQQAQGVLDAGANRAAGYANQAAAYGAQARNARRQGGLSMLQGGINAFGGLAGSGAFDSLFKTSAPGIMANNGEW